MQKERQKNSDVDILVDSGMRGLSFFGLPEDVVISLGKMLICLMCHSSHRIHWLVKRIKKWSGNLWKIEIDRL